MKDGCLNPQIKQRFSYAKNAIAWGPVCPYYLMIDNQTHPAMTHPLLAILLSCKVNGTRPTFRILRLLYNLKCEHADLTLTSET